MFNGNDIAEQLFNMGNRIEPVLKDLFAANYVKTDFLSDAFWYHMGSGGKRIRPALCLLTCKGMGGRIEDAIHFAAAVEILHNMFLVHDDIQDGDRIRRDQPAVWVKYGSANAINLGDYMLGRSYASILRSKVPPDVRIRLLEIFTRTYENTCKGQALDLNYRGLDAMDVEKYLEIVQLKTADYLVLGMIGGAVIAGVDDKILDSIRHLGTLMGPAFQIRDDLIDLSSGKGRGGELGNDIKEGKPSILFAHVLNEASLEEKKILLEIARKKRRDTDAESVSKVIDLYEKYGSIKYAESMTEQLTHRAYSVVEQMPIGNKDFFRQIVNFMAERTT